MANSQSHLREIADKKAAYNEGRLYKSLISNEKRIIKKFDVTFNTFVTTRINKNVQTETRRS